MICSTYDTGNKYNITTKLIKMTPRSTAHNGIGLGGHKTTTHSLHVRMTVRSALMHNVTQRGCPTIVGNIAMYY